MKKPKMPKPKGLAIIITTADHPRLGSMPKGTRPKGTRPPRQAATMPAPSDALLRGKRAKKKTPKATKV